jgi:hypothetical protein
MTTCQNPEKLHLTGVYATDILEAHTRVVILTALKNNLDESSEKRPSVRKSIVMSFIIHAISASNAQLEELLSEEEFVDSSSLEPNDGYLCDLAQKILLDNAEFNTGELIWAMLDQIEIDGLTRPADVERMHVAVKVAFDKQPRFNHPFEKILWELNLAKQAQLIVTAHPDAAPETQRDLLAVALVEKNIPIPSDTSKLDESINAARESIMLAAQKLCDGLLIESIVGGLFS